MASHNDDTDPSTPTARRLSEPAPGGTTSSRPPQGTDPGVAPPPALATMPPEQPLGIVVPPPSLRTPAPPALTPTPEPTTATATATARKKDSVEILLDGMKSQPDQPIKSSRESGRHSQPPVGVDSEGRGRRRHSSHPPKVVLDRPITPTVIRPRASDPVRATEPPSEGNEGGHGVSMAKRVIGAALAGALVAAAVFLILEATRARVPPEPPPQALQVEPATALPIPAATQAAAGQPSAQGAASPSPVPAQSAVEPPSATDSATTRVEAPTAPVRHHHRAKPASAASAAPSGDIGEFRPTP